MRQGLYDVRNRWWWNSKFGIIGNSIPIEFGDGGCAYHIAEFEAAARYGLLHFHLIGIDGVYVAGTDGHPEFHELRPPEDADVLKTVPKRGPGPEPDCVPESGGGT
jgi:hypothetical protein